jgi:uncharacterized GH25 family protein
MRSLVRSWFVLCLAALAARAGAHEFWIEPASFSVAPGASLGIALRVGDGLPGEPYKRNPKHIKRFVLVGPEGEADIPGQDGSDPAGSATLTAPGCYSIGYRSNPSRIELEPAKFEAYLKEEGLEHIVERRKASGQSDKPGRETYSRCAKSIVYAGDDAAPGHDRALGFELEFICKSSPASLRAGDEISLRLLHNGKPLPNAQVHAFCKGAASAPPPLRTNADGGVRLKLDQPGLWMFASTHMFEAPQGSDADWESLWASLTIEVREATAKPATGNAARP